MMSVLAQALGITGFFGAAVVAFWQAAGTRGPVAVAYVVAGVACLWLAVKVADYNGGDDEW